jgi:heavy metal translocating P-type ATPase
LSGAADRAGTSSAPYRQFALVGAVLAGLLAAGAAAALGASEISRALLVVLTAVVSAVSAVATARNLLRGEIGVDIIALLAMIGALLLGQYLVGAIIAVMLTGGTALEEYATARARRELSSLINRAPRIAHRRDTGGYTDVAVEQVAVGDTLLVKPGEVIPVDGIVGTESAVLDESSLTGESRPVKLDAGAPARSGGANAGGPFELRVTAPAAQSTYAQIIRLVQAAEGSKAPFARLADRYALIFLAVTLALAATAWLVSGEAERALAVLVVATPCPLILAVPAAIMGGVSRAARYGIIMKGGAPLETLARARVVLLDKTGTVTAARPEVVAVEMIGAVGADDLLRHAAALEQLSVHPFAPAILAEARDRGLALVFPSDVHEQIGAGVSGAVEGRRIAVGQYDFVVPGATRTARVRSIELRASVEGSSCVFVAMDGELAGVLLLQDHIRPEAPRVLRKLRVAGVRRILLVTGDRPEVAELVADALGIDRVFAERAPEDKVDVVRAARSEGITAMVGDGINDAPALALADVGIAMGARGATAASEAADVVLTSDRFEGLAQAVQIAQRTRRIALQSVWVGMGMSVIAMILAAAGFIAPIAGALLQEGIDVLVILNALRALAGRETWVASTPEARRLAQSLDMTHRSLRPRVSELAELAVCLDELPPAEALARLQRTVRVLEEELLPHESEEQQTVYPILENLLAGENPTGPLIHTHGEIRRLSRLLSRCVAHLPPAGPSSADLREIHRLLYGLHAILTLHFAQEDELYSLLAA